MCLVIFNFVVGACNAFVNKKSAMIMADLEWDAISVVAYEESFFAVGANTKVKMTPPVK